MSVPASWGARAEGPYYDSHVVEAAKTDLRVLY